MYYYENSIFQYKNLANMATSLPFEIKNSFSSNQIFVFGATKR